MVQSKLFNLNLARTAGMLSGASRVAMMLLTTLLLTMTAQTTWAVTLQVDPDIPEGSIGHYYLNMPTTGTNTLTLTAEDIAAGKGMFKVYDDGGKNGNYSNNCNGILIINSPEGYKLNVSGTMNLGGDQDDYLKIGVYNYYFDDYIFPCNQYRGNITTLYDDSNNAINAINAIQKSKKRLKKSLYIVFHIFTLMKTKPHYLDQYVRDN